MPSPFVYVAGPRLSTAELTAACLDGHLVALGAAYVPADLAESPWLRGASLEAVVGDTLAAARLTAAWVHGVVDTPPVRPCVQRAVPQRLHRVSTRGACYHDAALTPDEVVICGGVAVTTPARTIAELARFDGAGHLETLTAWCARDDGAAAGALRWLREQPRLPGGRAAAALIERVRPR